MAYGADLACKGLDLACEGTVQDAVFTKSAPVPQLFDLVCILPICSLLQPMWRAALPHCSLCPFSKSGWKMRVAHSTSWDVRGFHPGIHVPRYFWWLLMFLKNALFKGCFRYFKVQGSGFSRKNQLQDFHSLLRGRQTEGLCSISLGDPSTTAMTTHKVVSLPIRCEWQVRRSCLLFTAVSNLPDLPSIKMHEKSHTNKLCFAPMEGNESAGPDWDLLVFLSWLLNISMWHHLWQVNHRLFVASQKTSSFRKEQKVNS